MIGAESQTRAVIGRGVGAMITQSATRLRPWPQHMGSQLHAVPSEMDTESPNFFNPAYFQKYSNSRIGQLSVIQNPEDIVNMFGFDVSQNSLNNFVQNLTSTDETSVCFDCGIYNCDFGSVLSEGVDAVQTSSQKQTPGRSLVPLADFETDDFLELYQVNGLGCDQVSNSSNNSFVSSGSKDYQDFEDRSFSWTPLDVDNSETADENYHQCEDGDSDSKGACYCLLS